MKNRSSAATGAERARARVARAVPETPAARLRLPISLVLVAGFGGLVLLGIASVLVLGISSASKNTFESAALRALIDLAERAKGELRPSLTFVRSTIYVPDQRAAKKVKKMLRGKSVRCYGNEIVVLSGTDYVSNRCRTVRPADLEDLATVEEWIGEANHEVANSGSMCNGGTLVWQSRIDADDLGKNGDEGLFDDWGEIRMRPNTIKNLERAIAAHAPDGSLAYEYSVPLEKGTTLPHIAFDQTPGFSLKHLYASFQIWFPDGYWDGASGGQKFWNVWSEEEGQTYSPRYGREVVNDASSAFVAVPNRFRAYSYYRSRPEESGDVNDPDHEFWKASEGRWVTLGLELRLNDPGQSNGYLRFFIDGEEAHEPVGGLDWIRDPDIAGFQGFAWSGWNNGGRSAVARFWARNFVLCDLSGF